MSVNWMKLVAQGRAKAFGVSWTEEEAVALAKCNEAQKADLIEKLRSGLTLEAALSTVENNKPLSELSLKELKALAKEKGVKVPRGATKEDLVALLQAE